MLGKRLGLKVYPMNDARKELHKNAEIIYLGWVMGGLVRGYTGAAKRWRVRAVCGVCMGESGSQIENIRKMNKISVQLPVFTLQGGFDMKKLPGAYRMMMKMIRGSLEKQMEAKENRTPGEEAALNMLRFGGSGISEEHLEPVMKWLQDA